jgi:hypothetical protein
MSRSGTTQVSNLPGPITERKGRPWMAAWIGSQLFKVSLDLLDSLADPS